MHIFYCIKTIKAGANSLLLIPSMPSPCKVSLCFPASLGEITSFFINNRLLGVITSLCLLDHPSFVSQAHDHLSERVQQTR